MVRADKPRLEAALIQSPFSAQPKRSRCDRSGRQAAGRPFVLSLRENSVEQPAFQAGVNFHVRPGALRDWSLRAKSVQIESRFRSKHLFGRMILSEKSATFRDHAC